MRWVFGCLLLLLLRWDAEGLELVEPLDFWKRQNFGVCNGTATTSKFKLLLVIDEKEYGKEEMVGALWKTMVEGFHSRMKALDKVAVVSFSDSGVKEIGWEAAKEEALNRSILAPPTTASKTNRKCLCGAFQAMMGLVKGSEVDEKKRPGTRLLILVVTTQLTCGSEAGVCSGTGETPLDDKFYRDNRARIKTAIIARSPKPSMAQNLVAYFRHQAWDTWALPQKSWPEIEGNLAQYLYRGSRAPQPNDTECWTQLPVCFYEQPAPKGRKCIDKRADNSACYTVMLLAHKRPDLGNLMPVCEENTIIDCPRLTHSSCGLPKPVRNVTEVVPGATITGTSGPDPSVEVWVWLIPLIIALLVLVCCLILVLLWFLRRRRMKEAERKRPKGAPPPAQPKGKEWFKSFIPFEMTQHSGKSEAHSVGPEGRSIAAGPMSQGGQEVSAAVTGISFGAGPMTMDGGDTTHGDFTLGTEGRDANPEQKKTTRGEKEAKQMLSSKTMESARDYPSERKQTGLPSYETPKTATGPPKIPKIPRIPR